MSQIDFIPAAAFQFPTLIHQALIRVCYRSNLLHTLFLPSNSACSWYGDIEKVRTNLPVSNINILFALHLHCQQPSPCSRKLTFLSLPTDFSPEDHFSIDRLSQLSRTPSSVFALAFTPSRSSPRGRQPSLEVVTSPTTPTWQDPPQHPRLAVVLGIDPRYRHPLLACRSLCFCPSIWGTFKCIAAVWQVFDRRKDNVEFGCVATELWLAILWVVLFLLF